MALFVLRMTGDEEETRYNCSAEMVQAISDL